MGWGIGGACFGSMQHARASELGNFGQTPKQFYIEILKKQNFNNRHK